MDEPCIGSCRTRWIEWSRIVSASVKQNNSDNAINNLLWIAFSLNVNLIIAAVLYLVQLHHQVKNGPKKKLPRGKRALPRRVQMSLDEPQSGLEVQNENQSFKSKPDLKLLEDQNQEQKIEAESESSYSNLGYEDTEEEGEISTSEDQRNNTIESTEEKRGNISYLIAADMIQSLFCVCAGFYILSTKSAWICPLTCRSPPQFHAPPTFLGPAALKQGSLTLLTAEVVVGVSGWKALLSLAIGKYITALMLHGKLAFKHGTSAWDKYQLIYITVTIVCLFIFLMTGECMLISGYILLADIDTVSERCMKLIKCRAGLERKSPSKCLLLSVFLCGCATCLSVRIAAGFTLSRMAILSSLSTLSGVAVGSLFFALVFYSFVTLLFLGRLRYLLMRIIRLNNFNKLSSKYEENSNQLNIRYDGNDDYEENDSENINTRLCNRNSDDNMNNYNYSGNNSGVEIYQIKFSDEIRFINNNSGTFNSHDSGSAAVDEGSTSGIVKLLGRRIRNFLPVRIQTHGDKEQLVPIN